MALYQKRPPTCNKTPIELIFSVKLTLTCSLVFFRSSLNSAVQDLALLHGAILKCILLKAVNLLYRASSFACLSSDQKILFDTCRSMDDAVKVIK